MAPKASSREKEKSILRKSKSKIMPQRKTNPQTKKKASAGKKVKTVSSTTSRHSSVSVSSFEKFIISQGKIELTPSQREVIAALDAFLHNPEDRCILLKGYAGTGKTFLIKWIALYLIEIKRAVHLAAPTGRAAFVLSRVTGLSAKTIHSMIYSLRVVAHVSTATDAHGKSPRFHLPLKDSATDNASNIFIVDESSMITDAHAQGEHFQFGTGHLLTDLLTFTRLPVPDAKSKVIFVGDPCQLPPPSGGSKSPALDTDYLRKKWSFPVSEVEMIDVIRQDAKSGILASATGIRKIIRSGKPNYFDIDYSAGDILHVTRADLCLQVAEEYRKDRLNGLAVTWKNEEVFQLNSAIREYLWGKGEIPLRKGDRLVVAQNAPRSELLNGELVHVIKVNPKLDPHLIHVPANSSYPAYTLQFREVTMEKDFVPREDSQKRCLILENYLWSPQRDISTAEFEAVYWDFHHRFYTKHKERNPSESPKPALFKKELAEDFYFNAVRVKFGYALTCHKAQGGQWEQAGVVFDKSTTDIYSEMFLRWSYTAITRAQRKLYVVDPPRYTPISRIKPGYPLATSTPDIHADPLPALEYLEKFIQRHLKGMGISSVRHAPPIAWAEKYSFERNGKKAVLKFDYKKDDFFHGITVEKAKGTDPTFAAEVKDLIESFI